jgi:hypothetical protein
MRNPMDLRANYAQANPYVDRTDCRSVANSEVIWTPQSANFLVEVGDTTQVPYSGPYAVDRRGK